METLEELEYCLEQLETVQTHRSVSDMATSKVEMITTTTTTTTTMMKPPHVHDDSIGDRVEGHHLLRLPPPHRFSHSTPHSECAAPELDSPDEKNWKNRRK